jgi:uncharacterized protein (TIGR01244 family)
MTKIKLFFAALVTTTIVLLVIFYFSRPSPRNFHQLADGVFVSPQLTIADMVRLRRTGIQTVIDLRPDGEAADETPSETMKSIVQGNGMDFDYIPVPHEEIPDKAVAELSNILARQPKPALLYCRTGRRAARTFALVEASATMAPAGMKSSKWSLRRASVRMI